MTINNQSDIKFVWHYTKSYYLPLIEGSGFLEPHSEQEFAGKNPLLKGMYISTVPLIWFSSDQHWEHSTSQLADWRYKSWKEIAFEVSAVRYGISKDDPRLLNWEATCKVSGANREERRQRRKLIPHARKAGSNPALWFSCLEPIPLKDLYFQMWLDGQWTEVERDLLRKKLYQATTLIKGVDY
jgi:hypothetical protein